MSKLVVGVALLALLAAGLTGCGASADDGADAPLLAYLDTAARLRIVDTARLDEVALGGDVFLTAPFAWSPNGQLIAASDGVDVWTVRPGSPPERLTSLEPGERAVAVAWSADGLRVAYQVEGAAPRVDIVGRLGGEVTTAYSRGADLGGWWQPAGLDRPLLVVREPEDGAVYLVDIEAQTRRYIATADEVLASDGGAVRFIADGTRYSWTASEGPMPSSRGGLDSGASVVPASVQVLEEGGVISVAGLDTGEQRIVGEGSAPVLQPADGQAAPSSQALLLEPRNLLTETTSFERGVDGWVLTGFNAPVAAVTREDARYGDSAALVTFGGEQSVFAVDLGTARPAIHGREVTFSAWVRTREPGVHLRYLASNAEPRVGAVSEAHPGDGQWHRLSLTVTPTFNVGGTTSYSIVGVRATSTETALVDGVQVEYGARATDYEPAADDPLSALPRGEPIPR